MLLTDFGVRDPYVGTMKVVILGICPTVKIVDISHDIPKYDAKCGGFLLSQVAPYFPRGTVHLVVVDPDVGTDRRRIIIQCTQAYTLDLITGFSHQQLKDKKF